MENYCHLWQYLTALPERNFSGYRKHKEKSPSLKKKKKEILWDGALSYIYETRKKTQKKNSDLFFIF